MRQETVRRAYQLSLARFVTVGCVWIVLALVGTSREVTAQAKATIVSIEGATTTYQSIDRDGKPVTVRVPSQSFADIVEGRGCPGERDGHRDRTRYNAASGKIPDLGRTNHHLRCCLQQRSRVCRWAIRTPLPSPRPHARRAEDETVFSAGVWLRYPCWASLAVPAGAWTSYERVWSNPLQMTQHPCIFL